MSERPEITDEREHDPGGARAPRQDYEPPRLTVLGTFHELTRQQLKISGSSDFVAFQPAPSHP